jgi:hypothetical protein
VLMLVLYSRNPELRNPEVLVTFRNFGSCCVMMLVFVLTKPELRNPEVLVTFRNFGSCCVMMLASVLAKSRTRNPEVRVPPFLFAFRRFVHVDVWTLNSRSSSPENLKYGSHLSFSHFGGLDMLMFGHLNSQGSKPRNPDVRVPLSFSRFEELLWF